MKKEIMFVCLLILSVGFAVGKSTMSSPSVCCEKTNDGAFCINSGEENCNGNFKVSSTSCDSTSYCRQGTCYDSFEGICMENTPLRVCQQSNGTWDERGIDELPQCSLGCCILIDQAAFVPLVRCKRLSTFFGVEMNYRKDVNSEVECIATAQSQDMGACVFEKDFERICSFTTRGECGAEEGFVTGTQISGNEKKFYNAYLCSAEELDTACAPTHHTGCYQGKVYWFDSCGNRENIYSRGSESGKRKSWNNGKAAEPDEICSPNAGSDNECGNCDYLLGSRCSEWSGNFLEVGKPSGSDYYCKKTICKDRFGNERINGESWCVYDKPNGNGADSVGSRYFREICIDGEVRVEPCADFRNEVCLQDSMEFEGIDYGISGCRVNRWQDCVFQLKKSDCENGDRRDCLWLPPVTGLMLGGGSQTDGSAGFSNPTSGTFSNPTAPITGSAVSGEDEDSEETITNRGSGVCVPDAPPGFKFWGGSQSSAICQQASAKCVVKYEKKIIGGENCVENCECLEEQWALDMNRVCTALGDCGGYVNYLGKYTDDGYEWKVDGKSQKFKKNSVNKMINKVAGQVIGVDIVNERLIEK